MNKLRIKIDKESICQHLANFLSTTNHLRSLDLSGQPLSHASIKCLTSALQENENWVETLGLSDCDLSDDSATALGAYLHRK